MSLQVGGFKPTPAAKIRIRRGLAGGIDSFTANCHSIAATAYSTENYGYLGALAAKTGMFADYQDNFGVIGNTSAQGLPRIPTALASPRADVLIIPGVPNDFTNTSMTLADSKANILKMIELTKNTPGKYIIIGTGTPRFDDKLAAVPVARQPDMLAFKNWVMDVVSKLTFVVNIWDGFTQAMTVDNLHPNPLGADFLSERLKDVVNSNFEWSQIALAADSTDVYSVGARPFGSLVPNPLLSGTTGVIDASANPVAGSVLADSFKAQGSGLAGVTSRWYKQAAPVGEYQCIELGGMMTAAGGYIYMLPAAVVNRSQLAVGDRIDLRSLFEIVGAGQSGILGWEAELQVTKPVAGTSTNIYYRSMDKYQEPFATPLNMKGKHETQIYTFDGTETAINVRMGLYLASLFSRLATRSPSPTIIVTTDLPLKTFGNISKHGHTSAKG